jgi:3-methyladenine DNA glycosylase AlkD
LKNLLPLKDRAAQSWLILGMEINELNLLLKELGDRNSVPFMAKFGINPAFALGIRIPVLRRLSKEIGKNHPLALQLWEAKYHEGRILASMIANPEETTPDLADRWIKDFNSWDLCDQTCMNLFEKLPFAWDKTLDWCAREPEFEKRTGYVMIARLAVSDKKTSDKKFEMFFPLIIQAATDPRNFVKKAVNWAIRQIGKRSLHLNKEMIALSRQLSMTDNKTARWIAADAIRELESKAVQNMLMKKQAKVKSINNRI